MQTSYVQGQTEDASVFINTGFSIPSAPNEFSDYWKTGFNIGGGIGFPIIRNLRFQVDLEYNSFAFDEDTFIDDLSYGGTGISISGGTASILTAAVNLKALIPTGSYSKTPYLIGGVSFFALSISDGTVRYEQYTRTIGGDSDPAIGLSLGAGISFVMNPNMNIFIEARYGIGFTEDEDTQYIPFKVGLEFK
jgi:opacity protein-like surface antigen